jgi:hypothetical protein
MVQVSFTLACTPNTTLFFFWLETDYVEANKQEKKMLLVSASQKTNCIVPVLPVPDPTL